MRHSSTLHINAFDAEGRRYEYRMCVRDDDFGDIDLFFCGSLLGTYTCYSDAMRASEEHAAELELDFELPF